MVRRLLWMACLALAAASQTGCLALEQKLAFQPLQYPKGDWNLDDVPHEDAAIQAPDGTRLHGWFCSVPNRRAVVLYCHGNGGNVTNCDWVLTLFRERLNCSVLVFDYRGYGKSEGSPSEAGILSDARAARRWLAQRTGVAESDIVVVGHSLGGAVAVDLAAKDGARALVLQSTFTSFRDVADEHVPVLPVRSVVTMKLDSLSVIGQYHGPLLHSHGDADRVIAFEEGRRLFAAANEPKSFVTGHGLGHNDLPSRQYIEKLDWFLRTLPPMRGGG